MQGRFFVKEGSIMKKLLFLSCLFLVNIASAQESDITEIPFERPILVSQNTQENLPKQIVHQEDNVFDEVYTQVEEQKKAIRDLTERLEQAEHNLKKNEEKLEKISQDFAFRLNELENKPATIIDKTSDKDRYEYAQTLLKKKDYKQAEEQFLSFLKDFEKSNLRPNAIYWLGETYYDQQQYEKAVLQFAEVYETYPDSNKAPDALLKMGLSMVSLKKEKESCVAFIALSDKYPKAEESLKKRANEEAEKHKCL